MPYNEKQLNYIYNLNNLKSFPGCPQGCREICQRATQAATHLLAGREPEVAQEYPDCPNAFVVSSLVDVILNFE